MKKSSKVANFFAKYVSRVVFLVLVGLAYYFYTVFGTFDMFPPEWKEWLSYGLIGLCAIMGLICVFPKLPNLTRILSMVLNIFADICFSSKKNYSFCQNMIKKLFYKKAERKLGKITRKNGGIL